MKINLRIFKRTPAHTYITVFVDGANSGELIMSPHQAGRLYDILFSGAESDEEIEQTGDWTGINWAESAKMEGLK